MPENFALGKPESHIQEYLCSPWIERGEKLMAREFKIDPLPRPKIVAPDLAEIRKEYDEIIVEIGCGAGHHPYTFAKNNPKKFIFAIEHTKTRFKQMQNLISSEGVLSNMLPIHENAISWMAHYLPEKSLDKIFLLYPNPYVKPKDWNCRWHALPFWGHLFKLIKEDGHLQVATNIQDYAEQCLYFNLKHWKTKLISFEKVLPNTDRTAFEKKYLERNETCFDLVFSP